MAKKENEGLTGLRLKFAPHINRHHRITLLTTEQILMARMLSQNQQIIKQNRELIKLAKEISGKLSGEKPIEKKSEEKRTIHFPSTRVTKHSPPPEAEKPSKPTAKSRIGKK